MKQNMRKIDNIFIGIPVIRSFYKVIKENFGIIVGLLLLTVILSISNSNFFRASNLINILRNMSTNFFLAAGVMLCIIVGGIDLSGGMVVAMSGCVAAVMVADVGMPVVPALLIGCFSGLLVGLLNGIISAFTQIPPFIVTLATMNIAKGAAYIVSGGTSVRVENDWFEQIGLGYLGDIPLPVIYSIILAILMYFLLNKTIIGNHVYAIGGNRQAAIFSGIDVKKVTIIMYVISGTLSGFAGVILAGRMCSGQPTVGVGYEGDAIAAAVLGGTSMLGGIGKVGGVFLGALLIGILSNGLNLLNINSFWQYVSKGVVILIAVYIDSLRKK